jgi:large subunit ribosomal protein L6
MSRIGKLAIKLPQGVEAGVVGELAHVKGPKGTLSMNLAKQVKVEIAEGLIKVTAEDVNFDYLTGMTRTILANMVKGVTEGWSKTVELSGTGYRAAVAGNVLQLALGFSHPVNIPAPEGIVFEAKDNKITVRGADKGAVGEMAAKIRGLKPADPYKAKGFKYEGEVIVRKAGKAAKAGGAAGGK